MARNVAVKLDLEAAEYIAEAKAVKTATKDIDDQVKALGREVDATSKDMDELAAQAAVAKSQVDELGDEAKRTSTDLVVLDEALKDVGDTTDETSVSLEGLTKSSKTSQESVKEMAKKAEELAAALKALDARILATKDSIRALGIEFANTGDAKVGKDLTSERGLLGKLTKLRSELTTVAGDAAKAGADAGSAFSKGLDSALSSLGPAKGILFGTLITGAIAAAPLVGAIIGGAISGAVGTGAIGIGLLSASKDPRVQEAAKAFGAHVSSEFFGNSQAFAQPAIDSLAILQKGYDDLHLDRALAKAAPTVTKIAQAVADFADRAMPGIESALGRIGPFATVAAQGISDAGAALGGFIDDVSDSPGAVEGLETAFRLLNGTVIMLGKGINILEDAYSSYLNIENNLWEGLQKLADATNAQPVEWFANSQRRVFDELMNTGNAADTVNGHFAVMTGATIALNNEIDPFAAYLAAAARNLDDLNKSMDDYLSKNLSADQATLAFKDDVLALKESVKEHGRSLADNTQEGLNNQKMIQGLIGDAIKIRDATYAQTGSVQAADQAYKNQIDTLRVLLEKMGFTKKQIDDLTGTYEINIHTQFSYSGYDSKLAAMNKAQDRFEGRASGGPVLAGVPYRINERGFETVTFPAGGTVHPANLTPASGWQPASSTSYSSALPPVNLTVQLVDSITGTVTRQQLITDALQRNVPATTVSAAYP